MIFFQLTLYALWFLLGSMIASNSVKSFRNFDGSLSQVLDNLDTATLLRPITIAQNAFRFWYSLQLKNKNRKSSRYRPRISLYHKHLLSRQLDELPQDADPPAQTLRQTYLRHHPELDLVEPPEEDVQVGCDLTEVMSAEGVVEEFVLMDAPRRER